MLRLPTRNLILDAGKRLARFAYERTALCELGLEEAMALAQLTRLRAMQGRIRDAIEQPRVEFGTGDSPAACRHRTGMLRRLRRVRGASEPDRTPTRRCNPTRASKSVWSS